MKIPRIPVGSFQGTDWGTTNAAGKGSWPPRNLDDDFKDNFDSIRWGLRGPKPANGHTKIIYRNGRKTVFIGGEEQIPESTG